ncbi:MAG: dihydrolipoyl dehydrogenase [Candidatus Marinimicrobia bacterium]|nr:dihydrolipoyl dehydrogenase [Candidatus Neomarinimicrobiota bacterium]
MTDNRYDIVILGGGPGGYVAAIRANQLGMSVALVEDKDLGGICLNWGCIPTKTLLKSAEVYDQILHASDYGMEVSGTSFDMRKIVKRSRVAAERLSKGVGFLMKKNNVTVYNSRGSLNADANVVLSGGEELKSENVIIATGGRPVTIPGIDVDEEKIITSKTAMTLEEIPKDLVIIGAGAIGIEFGYFFSTFGSKVTLVEMMPQILPVEDAEVAKSVEESFLKRGMNIRTSTAVKNVEKTADGVIVTIEKDGKEDEISADIVLNAVGVRGNIEDIGLEEAGVETSGRFIDADSRCRTTRDGVWAIGDVIGPPLLAHVASAEGIAAVEIMAGKRDHGIDYSSIPGCTYCQPQVASFGLTEKAASEKGLKVKVGRFPFRANGKALAIGHYEGFVKTIFSEEDGELVGAHIVGDDATEMIGELLLARTHGATYKSIMETIHAHPTLGESIPEAAGDAYGEATNI